MLEETVCQGREGFVTGGRARWAWLSPCVALTRAMGGGGSVLVSAGGVSIVCVCVGGRCVHSVRILPLFLLRAQKLLTTMFPREHESSLLKSILVITKPTGHNL